MMAKNRRTIASILLITFLLAGCSGEGRNLMEGQSPTTPGAEKGIYPSGPSLGDVGNAEVFNVLVADGKLKVGVRWPSEHVARMVEVQYSKEVEAPLRGFSAVLKNGLQTTFELDFSELEDGTNRRTVEICGKDRLQIDLEKTSKATYKESYGWDGGGLIFNFDPETISKDEKKSKLLDFHSFYPGSSLDSNPEGDKLAGLITNIEFWVIVEDALVTQGQISADEKFNWGNVGSSCTVVSFFKCTFGGGLMNPLCIACIGIGLAIAVADLLCLIPFINCD